MNSNALNFAREQDRLGKSGLCRDDFYIPAGMNRSPSIYLVGNSLGPMPRRARVYLEQEMEDWARLGVRGHFDRRHPWFSYQENFSGSLGKLVGARPSEVVAMNSLTVNLHLLMASFYQPKGNRRKILIETGAFPSDRYAVSSQIRWHGLEPEHCLVELPDSDAMLNYLANDRDCVALVLLGGVHYHTGEVWDMAAIGAAAKEAGARIGLDLAHAIGNVPLQLHDWEIDFAAWCSYKYLNSGPGAIGGAFVHESHSHWVGPRLEGWWGCKPDVRFQMLPQILPHEGVRSWQLSNPPILSSAPLLAALEIFDQVGMVKLRELGDALTQFAEEQICSRLLEGSYRLLTPPRGAGRGSQLSIQGGSWVKDLVAALEKEGILCDFRSPDVLRFAPVALFNTYEEVYTFAEAVGKRWQNRR